MISYKAIPLCSSFIPRKVKATLVPETEISADASESTGGVKSMFSTFTSFCQYVIFPAVSLTAICPAGIAVFSLISSLSPACHVVPPSKEKYTVPVLSEAETVSVTLSFVHFVSETETESITGNTESSHTANKAAEAFSA